VESVTALLVFSLPYKFKLSQSEINKDTSLDMRFFNFFKVSLLGYLAIALPMVSSWSLIIGAATRKINGNDVTENVAWRIADNVNPCIPANRKFISPGKVNPCGKPFSIGPRRFYMETCDYSDPNNIYLRNGLQDKRYKCELRDIKARCDGTAIELLKCHGISGRYE